MILHESEQIDIHQLVQQSIENAQTAFGVQIRPIFFGVNREESEKSLENCE